MKYKVNDFITEGNNLAQIIAVDDVNHKYLLKIIRNRRKKSEGLITEVGEGIDRNDHFRLYDVNDPVMKEVNEGRCCCSDCGKELSLGESVIIDSDGNIYCDGNCLAHSLGYSYTIAESDMEGRQMEEGPLFDITKEEIEQLKKEVTGS